MPVVPVLSWEVVLEDELDFVVVVLLAVEVCAEDVPVFAGVLVVAGGLGTPEEHNVSLVEAPEQPHNARGRRKASGNNQTEEKFLHIHPTPLHT